jgi:hypothetical protein
LCTAAPDLADSTEGISSAGCAQFSGGRKKEIKLDFAAGHLIRRGIEKGGWGWKIAFIEVFGPLRSETFRVMRRPLNLLSHLPKVRRHLSPLTIIRGTSPRLTMSEAKLPTCGALDGSRAEQAPTVRASPSSAPLRSVS